MKSRGFTLIELITAICIIALLVTIGGPSFSSTLEQMRVQKSAEFLVQLINTARSEALRRNANVYLAVTKDTFCLGTTTPCMGDISTVHIAENVTITPSSATLKFDNVRGLPPAIGANYIVTSGDTTSKVSVNMLGLVKISGG